MVLGSSSETHHMSFQEIMDILAIHPCTVESTECQTDEKMDEQKKILVCKS
jgi:hypothetical protein